MFCIRIAGVTVGIENMYGYVEALCRDYIYNGSPDFCVIASPCEIVAEQKASKASVSAAYAESACLCRKICRELPKYKAFLFHSAAVECDGAVYAFFAPSGVGKSTHTSLWLKHFGDRARIINGDKPIFRFDGNRLLACGSPWCGKEGKNINAEVPIRALCFIERGERNEIHRLSPAEAVEKILPQLLLPNTEPELDLLLSLTEKMLGLLPFYALRCTVSDEAVTLAYNTMNEVLP